MVTWPGEMLETAATLTFDDVTEKRLGGAGPLPPVMPLTATVWVWPTAVKATEPGLALKVAPVRIGGRLEPTQPGFWVK